MKFTLSAEEHKELPESLQGEYAEKDGNFTLKLEGHEEHLVPKFKKDEAERHRKEAETKLLDVEKRNQKLMDDLESNKGNAKKMDELRESHQKEVEAIKEEYAEREKAAKAESHKAMIHAAATEFAEKHSTVPSLLGKAYAERLSVEEVDGQAVLRVLEVDGKQSIKAVSDLQKEFLDNPEYKSIIKGSSGSGGGASGGTGGKGGGAAKQITRSEFDSMNPSQRMEFSKDVNNTVVDD